MISCPACAKPKSNAPHPQNNEHTFSRPADTAYTREKKEEEKIRRGEVSERIARKQKERKKERKKIRTNCAKRRDRALNLSLNDAREKHTHCETPNIEKPNTHKTYLLYIYRFTTRRSKRRKRAVPPFFLSQTNARTEAGGRGSQKSFSLPTDDDF